MPLKILPQPEEKSRERQQSSVDECEAFKWRRCSRSKQDAGFIGNLILGSGWAADQTEREAPTKTGLLITMTGETE